MTKLGKWIGVIFVGVMLCTGGRAAVEGRAQGDTADTFKMILRLWPAHHTDSVLRNEVIEALYRYPGVMNEVWLCMEFETLSLQKHRQSAEAMAQATQQFRKAGVEVSIQGISLGHGDNFESGAEGDYEDMTWGTIVGANGVRTLTSHCPRQPAFHRYLEQEYTLYAERCKPNFIWLDDDLRITYHTPARQLCFCDLCLSEFNRQQGSHWTRETLVEALERNEGEGEVRRQWIAFTQESLAEVARVIGRSIHKVSPSTGMGLQHANFHRELQEGHDWNPIFAAMREETGRAPASRPGNGFYDDHAPRGMIVKAYDMARQIRRLDPSIRQIASEVEGYRHCATGKSPYGLCVESQLYLAMGATQLSYAIICAASEPMSWYADNYFKPLAAWRPFYEEYVRFNRGTEPGGVDPYVSPDQVLRTPMEGEPFFNWSVTGSGAFVYDLAALGIPFTPDGHYASLRMMDAEAVEGLPRQEAVSMFASQPIMLDASAWAETQRRELDTLLQRIPTPDSLADVVCYRGVRGGRVAVVASYSAAISNAERMKLLYAMDWLCEGRLPVRSESAAQLTVVPRVDPQGALRSVTVLNSTISEQRQVRLRLRGCPAKGTRLIWKQAEHRDQPLKVRREGADLLVEIPVIGGWNIGWIAVESR